MQTGKYKVWTRKGKYLRMNMQVFMFMNQVYGVMKIQMYMNAQVHVYC